MGQDQPDEIESGEKAVRETLSKKIEKAIIEGCLQKKDIILSLNFMDFFYLKSSSDSCRKIQDIFNSAIETLRSIGYVFSEKKRGFCGEDIDFVFTLTYAPHIDTLSRLRLRSTMNKGNCGDSASTR
jgi:hypothetical protein